MDVTTEVGKEVGMPPVVDDPRYPYEDTRTWDALRSAIAQLERAGALRLIEGERIVLAVLCRALDRAGVFSLGESRLTTSRR